MRSFPVLLLVACKLPGAPVLEEIEDALETEEPDSEPTDTATEEPEPSTTDTGTPTTTTTTGPQEPTPVFEVGNTPSGQLAIDESGIRTFFFEGLEYYSVLFVSLTEEGSDESCAVTLIPELDRFDNASTSTRDFPTVIIDLGRSTILDDACGWDDEWILSEFAAFGTVEIGLSQARFPEDRPFLDVYHDRSWGLDDAANITLVAAGTGWAMEADGTVGGYDLVEPDGRFFLPGLYEF